MSACEYKPADQRANDNDLLGCQPITENFLLLEDETVIRVICAAHESCEMDSGEDESVCGGEGGAMRRVLEAHLFLYREKRVISRGGQVLGIDNQRRREHASH